jgi:predicted transposase/invertase (TIGR01784 family)
VEFPDRKILEFNYAAIQLNRLDWRDYLNTPNPVAAALMAKMAIAPADRPKVKAECLRLLVTLKLNPAKSRLISQFVDTYLRLNVAEEQAFQAEIDRLDLRQKEKIMYTMTSWEEKGLEKGIEQGIEQERRTIARNMINDNLPAEQIIRLTGLTNEQLQQLQAQEP